MFKADWRKAVGGGELNHREQQNTSLLSYIFLVIFNFHSYGIQYFINSSPILNYFHKNVSFLVL